MDEAVLVARRFEAARATLEKIKQENQRPSTVSHVNSGRNCFNCGELGHIARNCPKKRVSNEPKDVTCFRCHRQGHLSPNCPNKGEFRNTQSAQTNRIDAAKKNCFRCGKVGHIAKFCRVDWSEITAGGETEKQRKNDDSSKLSSVSDAGKRKTLVVEALIETKRVLCVLDSGASISLMSKSKWNELKVSKDLLAADIIAEAANNEPLGIFGRVELDLEIEGKHFAVEFFIVEKLAHEILLGLNWMDDNKVDLLVGKKELHFQDGTVCPLFIHDSSLLYPGIVTLSEDVEIPGRHEIVSSATLKMPAVADSV
eukprot:gene6369-7101_t